MIRNIIWFLAVFCLVLGLYIPSYSKLQDLRQRNVNLQQEIVELKQKNAELAEERRLLKEDPVYLEKVAREKMGIVREGEVVYRLRPEAVEEDQKQ